MGEVGGGGGGGRRGVKGADYAAVEGYFCGEVGEVEGAWEVRMC